MQMPLYIENSDVIKAEELISNYGIEASLEAAERAEKSRNLGNHISFARWRQIERLIILLSGQKALGTLH